MVWSNMNTLCHRHISPISWYFDNSKRMANREKCTMSVNSAHSADSKYLDFSKWHLRKSKHNKVIHSSPPWAFTSQRKTLASTWCANRSSKELCCCLHSPGRSWAASFQGSILIPEAPKTWTPTKVGQARVLRTEAGPNYPSPQTKDTLWLSKA